MKKTFLPFFFSLLPLTLWATDITAPVLDLGTITYTGSNPGSTVFTASSLTTQSISVTGDGINSPGPSYTSFNLKNMSYGGQNKNVFLKIAGSSYTISDPCGEIAITDMSLQNYSVALGPITIKKLGGRERALELPKWIFL